MWGEARAVRVHFFLCGAHFSLQEFLKTRNSLQCLTGEVQHVLDAQAVAGLNKWRWSRSLSAWGVVENYSSALEQACQDMYPPLRVQLHEFTGLQCPPIACKDMAGQSSQWEMQAGKGAPDRGLHRGLTDWPKMFFVTSLARCAKQCSIFADCCSVHQMD